MATLKQLIDEALAVKEERDLAEAKYDELAGEIKERCKKQKIFEVEGKVAIAKISAQSGTTIPPQEFMDLCLDIGIDETQVYEMFKVKIKEAKKVVGEAHLESIANTWTNPYGRLTLKRVK